MKCSRWISVCVDMSEHPVVGMQVPPPPALDKNKHAQTPFAAWIDLLSSANWKDTEYDNKGQVITLKRGEFVAGRAYWSKRWNWTENAVRGFFSRLVANGMVEFSHQSSGHSANVATVCNYDAYQQAKPAKNQSDHQSTTSQPPDSYKDTILGRENAQARDGETEVHAGVFVNCETIRHRDFTISIPAIELQLLGTVSRDEIKAIATGQAIQWATDIAAGKKNVAPSSPANFIRQSIQNQRNKAAASAMKAGQQRRTEAAPHRISPDTKTYVRPAPEAF